MNTAKKAALLSALLFPGWGQIYLKHYKRGLIFILPVLMGTLALAWVVVQAGITIIKAAPFKKGTMHFNDVIQVTVNAIKALDPLNFLFILLLLAALWILSIVDAYLLGKKQMTAPIEPTIAVDQESTSNPV